MPNRVPGVNYTEAQHSSMRTSLSSAGVSWRTLIGYPSYARNRACALPSPLPFHYVMAKIVPVVQLAAHAKSSTLYVQIFSASCATTISYNYGVTLRALRVPLKRTLCRMQNLHTGVANTEHSPNTRKACES